MKPGEKPLSETNPYLRDSKLRKKLIVQPHGQNLLGGILSEPTAGLSRAKSLEGCDASRRIVAAATSSADRVTIEPSLKNKASCGANRAARGSGLDEYRNWCLSAPTKETTEFTQFFYPMRSSS